MATTRIKDVSKTTTDLASDEYIVADGATNGTQKMARDDAYADWAAAYVAAPTTYKLAPLNSGTNKIDATYLPTGADTAKGAWDADNTTITTLSDGSGVAGDYYDITDANGGTIDQGAGTLAINGDSVSVGDVIKYDGSNWYIVPAVANVLDGSATAAAGRTTLEVNSIDEDAEATGTKLVSPSLYFDGTNDYLEVADSDKLSFTDGTDDLPFSISAWVKMEDATDFSVVSKFTSTSGGEWILYTSSADNLWGYLGTSSGNYLKIVSAATMTQYEGQWVNFSMTYGGSGPNSTYSFSSGFSALKLYVNGAELTDAVGAQVGTYAGMANGSHPVRIGRYSSVYGEGEIKQVQLFNRELSAAEIEDVYRHGQLGFADQWGGANGGVYTSDFSNPDVGGDEDLDGFSATRGTVDGNIDTIGGQDDNLRLTVTDTTNNTHYLSKSSVVTVGKRTRFSLDFYIPSGQSNVDGIQIRLGSTVVATETSPTLDSWVTITGEGIPNSTALRVDALDGGSGSFQDAGGDDVLYVRNVTVTEIGTLADFRASNFDVDTGKLYDLSDNAFIGTNTGSTLVGRALPVYETGTWTPSLEFGGASVGITYGDTEGVYTRVGNQVTIQGIVTLTSKGSSTGFVRLLGLPFAGADGIKSYNGIFINQAGGMASLTSIPSMTIVENTTEATIQDWSATGSGGIDDTYFTNTSSLRFSGTYQIQ